MEHLRQYHMLKHSFVFMTLLASSLIGISTVYQPATVDALPRGNYNWIVICYHLDLILIPSCDNLVSADNVLPSEGRRAIACIQDGVTRVGGSEYLSELDPYAIIQVLKLYASEPPRCVGIVKWRNADNIDIDGENGIMLKAIISRFS
jgi:hypothetical protein